MITTFTLDVIFSVLSGMLAMLPDITWSPDSNWVEVVLSVMKVVGYLVPWDTVVAIISIVISFTIFRIVISIIKTIWDLLPVV